MKSFLRVLTPRVLTLGEYPPSPENSNFGRSWHFECFEFWVLSFEFYIWWPSGLIVLFVCWWAPLPFSVSGKEGFIWWWLWKVTSLPQAPNPTPPPVKLGRSWHFEYFEFWLWENTPPPTKIFLWIYVHKHPPFYISFTSYS